MPRKELRLWPDFFPQEIRAKTYHLSEISNLISNKRMCAMIGGSLKSIPHSPVRVPDTLLSGNDEPRGTKMSWLIFVSRGLSMGLLSDIQFQFLLGGLCVLERAERTGPPASPERAQPRDGGF
jgi:hypothetical protein